MHEWFCEAYFCSEVLVTRTAVKDFTFSNGITVPAGTFIGVATHATHFDNVRDSTCHGLSRRMFTINCSISIQVQTRSTDSDFQKKEKEAAKA